MNFGSLFLLPLMSVSNKKNIRKDAHASLVYVVKIYIHPKSYECLRSILVDGGLALDVFFATY